MPDIKTLFIAAIERTGNPLAPLVLDDCYSSCDALGRLLASSAEATKTETYIEILLDGFGPREIDEISAKPEFIIALAGLLSSALVSYGKSLKRQS